MKLGTLNMEVDVSRLPVAVAIAIDKLNMEVDVSRRVCRRQCIEGCVVAVLAAGATGGFGWLALVAQGGVATTFAVFSGLWSLVILAAGYEAVDAWRAGREIRQRRVG